MITVKVIQFPGLIKDVQVADTATAGDAMRAAGATGGSNYTVKLNGLESSESATLRDGDSIIVSQGAKGN
jgi:hypothetical protein